MQDLKTLRDNFKKELELASIGKESSIPYIKVNLPKINSATPSEYQVMVLGGTNFSSAVVKRSGSDIELYDVKKEKFSKFESAKDLFSFIFKYIDFSIDLVCLNFAFPMEPVLRDLRIDGILKSVPKDHRFTELIGLKIGEELEKYINEKEGKKIKFSVANDSICLLMAGISVSDKRNIVGGILGTGFNIGIFHDEFTAVNTEAACFDKFEPSRALLAFDKDTLNPGQHLFEKEISGNYLYKHFNFLIEDKKINHRPVNSTQELFAIARGGAEDESIIKVANEIFKRSAQYLAAVYAGVAEFKNMDIDIVTQGAMFTDFYKEILMDEVEKLTDKRIMLYKINDSSRLGAALLI